MQYRINAGYLPLDHWTQDLEQGGGRIIGEVCHFIDLLQFFAKATVQQVYAQALPNLGKYRDDNVAINLVLKDGSIGAILYVANGDKSLPKEALEVFGQGKAAILEDFRKVTLVAGGRAKSSNAGGQNKGHAAEMAAWVDAIRGGQPEPVPFEYSVAATRASFAVIKSLSTGQPVKVE
jgi:predicted dehydrogenase